MKSYISYVISKGVHEAFHGPSVQITSDSRSPIQSTLSTCKSSLALASDVLSALDIEQDGKIFDVDIQVEVFGRDGMIGEAKEPMVIMRAYTDGNPTEALNGYEFLSEGKIIGSFGGSNCKINADLFYNDFELCNLEGIPVRTRWNPRPIMKNLLPMHILGAR